MELAQLSKKMMTVVCISLLLLVAGSAAYYRSSAFLPFALGAALGAGASALKIKLLQNAVEKAVNMEKDRAESHLRLQHLLRFLLTGVVLLCAALVPFISLWGAAAGVLTQQIATYSARFFMR